MSGSRRGLFAVGSSARSPKTRRGTSERKIDFNRLDQRNQPPQQFLVYWMPVVPLERRRIRKFHRPAKLIALSSRRNVQPDPRLLHLFNLILQLPNFGHAMIFLLARHAALESKRKHMDVHDRPPPLEMNSERLNSQIQKSSPAIFRDHAPNVNRITTAQS